VLVCKYPFDTHFALSEREPDNDNDDDDNDDDDIERK